MQIFCNGNADKEVKYLDSIGKESIQYWFTDFTFNEVRTNKSIKVLT
jgi:SecD/SecF fusion protein